jgi:hypothetical protein
MEKMMPRKKHVAGEKGLLVMRFFLVDGVC